MLFFIFAMATSFSYVFRKIGGDDFIIDLAGRYRHVVAQPDTGLMGRATGKRVAVIGAGSVGPSIGNGKPPSPTDAKARKCCVSIATAPPLTKPWR
ncbi:MAG: hypothetical protein ACU0CA_15615 [Paracoccaceae bacterium]